jgi:hypothetical protein
MNQQPAGRADVQAARNPLDARIWSWTGHLSEVAVGALADGELELLPETAICHAEACPTCGERVGRAALTSVALAEALAAAAAPGAPPDVGVPVPRPARR